MKSPFDDADEGGMRGSALSRRAVLSLPIVTTVASAANVIGGCAAPRHLPCATPRAAESDGAHAHCSMRHCRHYRLEAPHANVGPR